MKMTRAWIYGGSAYVLGIMLLWALPGSVGDMPLQAWAFFASLPFGLLANFLSYFVLVAGWMLFNADPFSMYVVWLLQATLWMTGAACNVVLAWLAWTGVQKYRVPCLGRFARVAPDRCRWGLGVS